MNQKWKFLNFNSSFIKFYVFRYFFTSDIFYMNNFLQLFGQRVFCKMSPTKYTNKNCSKLKNNTTFIIPTYRIYYNKVLLFFSFCLILPLFSQFYFYVILIENLKNTGVYFGKLGVIFPRRCIFLQKNKFSSTPVLFYFSFLPQFST